MHGRRLALVGLSAILALAPCAHAGRAPDAQSRQRSLVDLGAAEAFVPQWPAGELRSGRDGKRHWLEVRTSGDGRGFGGLLMVGTMPDLLGRPLNRTAHHASRVPRLGNRPGRGCDHGLAAYTACVIKLIASSVLALAIAACGQEAATTQHAPASQPTTATASALPATPTRSVPA